jgi:branched-chain amino acid transport system substrate-binding protein
VKTLAVVYVDDLFGLENYGAFKVALKSTNIQVVEEKSYPGDIKDLSPVLRSIKDKNPDAFIGLSYPPDTILASKQSKEIGFNPKFYYASVGTAFQLYKNVMTPAGAEGVLGMGSWNTKTSPGAKAYFDAHTKKFGGKEPDRWASGHCWAGLEIMQAAVAKAGLDRKAIRDYVATTIVGDIKFTGSENTATPGTVSQWQNGEFEVVWPVKSATAKLNPNKPAWK